LKPVTPLNILRHELIGLKVRVSGSRYSPYRRIEGKVSDETRNMLYISTENGVKKVPKYVSTFHFTVSDGTVVEVEGCTLVGRPEDRVQR